MSLPSVFKVVNLQRTCQWGNVGSSSESTAGKECLVFEERIVCYCILGITLKLLLGTISFDWNEMRGWFLSLWLANMTVTYKSWVPISTC